MIWEFILTVIVVYVMSIAIFTLRALKGPTVGDQVLAIDAISYVTVVLMVLFSVYFKEPVVAVVAIPLALWVYALDIYLAKYLERGDLGA